MKPSPLSVLYFGTTDGKIHPFRVEKNGTLAPITEPETALPAALASDPAFGSVIGMATTPNKKFLYAANTEDHVYKGSRTLVKAYRVAPDGCLTPLEQTMTVDDGISHVLIDPKGYFLYLSGSKALLTYRIGAAGELRFRCRNQSLGLCIQSDTEESRNHARQWDFLTSEVAFFDSGNSALVYRYHAWNSGHMKEMGQYKILADGTWKQVPSLLDNRNDEFHGPVYFFQKGKLVYRNAKEFTRETPRLEAYQVHRGNVLTRVPRVRLPNRLKRILGFDPLERFVFGGSSNSLETYRVHPDGSLTLVATTPAKHEETVFYWDGMFVDATGHFLYAAHTHDTLKSAENTAPVYAVFAVQANGKLLPTQQRITLPANWTSLTRLSLP